MNQHDQMRKHILDLYNAVSKACGDLEKAVKATIKSQGSDYKAIKQALAAEPEPTVEPSEDAKRTLANPPERIYLQVGDVDAEFPGEIHWRDVTWCADQIERNDLVYVRGDLAERAPLVRLTDEEIDSVATLKASALYRLCNKPERDDLKSAYKEIANAVMDAMQERNK